MPNLLSAFVLCLMAALSVSAAPTAGCGKVPTLHPNLNNSVLVGAKAREFIAKLPEHYDNKHPYKLVFTFHYMTGTATQIANGNAGNSPYYGLSALANNSAIFVSPNGQPEPSGRFAGLMGWANTDGEDIQFVDAMLKAILDDLCVESDLIFSTGFSYGGAISYALVCARAHVFRAVGILSGGTMSGCDGGTPKVPIAYYQQHGAHDSILNITMARSMRDAMLQINGCKPVASDPAAPPGGHTSVVYEGCNPHYPLTWTIFDGDHTPTFKDTGATSSFSPKSVWNFFSQFG